MYVKYVIHEMAPKTCYLQGVSKTFVMVEEAKYGRKRLHFTIKFTMQ